MKQLTISYINYVDNESCKSLFKQKRPNIFVVKYCFLTVGLDKISNLRTSLWALVTGIFYRFRCYLHLTINQQNNWQIDHENND